MKKLVLGLLIALGSANVSAMQTPSADEQLKKDLTLSLGSANVLALQTPAVAKQVSKDVTRSLETIKELSAADKAGAMAWVKSHKKTTALIAALVATIFAVGGYATYTHFHTAKPDAKDANVAPGKAEAPAAPTATPAAEAKAEAAKLTWAGLFSPFKTGYNKSMNYVGEHKVGFEIGGCAAGTAVLAITVAAIIDYIKHGEKSMVMRAIKRFSKNKPAQVPATV